MISPVDGRILELYASGTDVRIISRILFEEGFSHNTIYHRLWNLRRKGLLPPKDYYGKQKKVYFMLPEKDRLKLADLANEMSMSIHTLAKRLLMECAKEPNLIKNILDER